MHTKSLPARRLTRTTLAVVSCCCALMFVIGGAGGTPAEATPNDPAVTLQPGQSVVFRSWWGASTTVCAYAFWGGSAVANVDPAPWTDNFQMTIAPWTSSCVTGSFWGASLRVKNQGSVPVFVYNNV